MARKEFSVVYIGGEGDPLAAPTLPLAAALIALGCLPLPDSPFVDFIRAAPETGTTEGEEPKREHRWMFSEKSTCGRYQTDALRKNWVSATWLANNFSHPLARIRAAFYIGGVLPLEPFSEWIDAAPADLDHFRTLATTAGPLPDQLRTNAEIALAFRRLQNLRDEITEANVPLLEVRKGDRRVLIPLDATPEEEAFLLSKLEPK